MKKFLLLLMFTIVIPFMMIAQTSVGSAFGKGKAPAKTKVPPVMEESRTKANPNIDACAEINPFFKPAPSSISKGDEDFSDFQLLDYFSTHLAAGGEQGIAADNSNIYTAKWATNGAFSQYTMAHAWIKDFTISGVGGIRDLTYDGTYFYGGGGAAVLYCMNFSATTPTLVSTITCTGRTIRHCSYDPVSDGFWVGDWTNLFLVTRAGATTFTGPTFGSGFYGSGYDPTTNLLYLFSQIAGDPGTGTKADVFSYDRSSNTYSDVLWTPALDLTVFNAGIAGGAFYGNHNGTPVLYLNVQQGPCVVAIYNVHPVICDPVRNFTAAINGNAIDLTWQAPVNTSGLTGYELREGSTLLATLSPSTLSYTISAPVVGMHQYNIKAIFPSCSNFTPTRFTNNFYFDTNPCNLHIVLTDSYGDGWNGNYLTVKVDGTQIGSNLTISGTSGAYTAVFDVTIPEGVLEIAYVKPAGSTYPAENGIEAYALGYNKILNISPGYFPSNLAVGTYVVYTDDFICGGIVTPPPPPPPSGCDYVFKCHDSYGDGWNNGKIEIYAGGTFVADVTLATGNYGEVTRNIPGGGINVQFVWVPGVYGGIWDYEVSCEIESVWGTPLFSFNNPSQGVLFTFSNVCEAIPNAVTISGTVTKLAGGAGIAGATINYIGTGSPTATTNASGAYSLEAPQGYTYTIEVSAPGYNKLTELSYTIPSTSVTKNYQMTAPTISVTPTTVDRTTPYMVDAHATVTVTNGGNGPLNWAFAPDYLDKAENTVAYAYEGNYDKLYSFPLNNISNFTSIGNFSPSGFCSSGDWIDGVWYLASIENGAIYTADPTTGASQLLCNVSQVSAGIAGIAGYNGEIYLLGVNFGLYTLNPATGQATLVKQITNSVGALCTGMTITNDGTFIAIDLVNNKLFILDPVTGTMTPSINAYCDINFGQDISMDRETNTPYWGLFSYDSWMCELNKVDLIAGTLTTVGTTEEQMTALAIPTLSGWLKAEPSKGVLDAGQSVQVEFTMDGWWAESGTWHANANFKSSSPEVGTATTFVTFTIAPPACNAPTNLQATVADYNNVVLTWTAPSKGTNTVLLTEAFDGATFPPTGWTRIDADGDGNNWQQSLAGQSHSGSYAASSNSYINYVGPLTPDNWLITPQLNASGGGTIHYYVAAQDPSYAADHYGVYISTTGTSPSNFTLLFEETITAKSGVKGEGERGANNVDFATWRERTVNFTQTGNVYIAFRHFNCTDMYIMLIDDVEISTGGGVGPNGLVNYNIYKAGETNVLATAPGNVTTYTLNNVAPAGTYCYVVRAVYDDGCVSMASNQACATVSVKMRTVEGNVTNALSGAAINGANVRFDGSHQYTTNNAGHYTASLPLGSTYNVIFSAPDYNNFIQQNYIVQDQNPNTLNAQLLPIECNPVQNLVADKESVPDHVVLTWDPPTSKGAKELSAFNPASSSELCPTAKFTESNADAKWDLLSTWSTASGGEQGIVTDGNYFYTTTWLSNGSFSKYSMSGTYISTFTIPGIGALRDMTFDGTYYYAGAASTTLYCFDLDAHTLIQAIPSQKEVRHCTYDPDFDGFWVGNWYDLNRINRQGVTQQVAPSLQAGYGSAYDNTGDTPVLWIFNQAGSSMCAVYKYDIATNQVSSSPVLEVNMTPHYVSGSLAGGAYSASIDGLFCFICDVQADQNDIAIFELGVAPNQLTLTGYEITRNGALIGTVGANVLTYTDDVTGMSGLTTYCVKAIYTLCESGDVCQDVLLGIGSHSNLLSVYPNPANNVVNIEGERVASIVVYNNIGQVVAKYENLNSIDVTAYKAGIYMFNITTVSNAVEVKKVVISH